MGLELSAENKRMLWAPPGLAHGFAVLSDWADFLYKTTGYYTPSLERTILWNDRELDIEWPIAQPILSVKDAAGRAFLDAEVFETDPFQEEVNAEP